MKYNILWVGLFVALFVFAESCDKSRDQTTPKTTLSDVAKKGKVAYFAHCIACHNSDPSKNGALGPSVAGSSLELLQIRIVEAKYPEDYQPKRNTKIMQPLPHLNKDIEALHAFLN